MKKETAVATYQALVEKHPEFADAWHNIKIWPLKSDQSNND